MQKPSFFPKGGIAVLVIDMQPVFINSEKNKEEMIPNQLVVLKRCIDLGMPVFIVEFKAFNFEGTIKELLDVLPSEESCGYKRITKRTASAFPNTGLKKALDDLDVGTLILMGISTCGCVYQTAVDARMLGYNLITIRNLMAASCSSCNSEMKRCEWFPENSKHFTDHIHLLEYLENNFSCYLGGSFQVESLAPSIPGRFSGEPPEYSIVSRKSPLES